MSKKRITTEEIGAKLLEAAKANTEEALPLSTKIFPYIFIASRRMSLRAISRWLDENYQVSLTAASISRALSNPEVHLNRLAEFIAAPARYVATLYGCDPLNLLFGMVFEDKLSELENLAEHIHKQPEGDQDIHRWSEMQDLASIWNPIPHEVQLLLKPYFEEIFADFSDDQYQPE